MQKAKRIEAFLRPDGFALVDLDYMDYVVDAAKANTTAIKNDLRAAHVPVTTQGCVLDLRSGQFLVHKSILKHIGVFKLIEPTPAAKVTKVTNLGEAIQVTVEIEVTREFSIEL